MIIKSEKRSKFWRPAKNQAKQFDFQLTSNHPRARCAVEELYSRISLPTNKRARQAIKQEALMRAVANLLWSCHLRRGIYYSRDRNYYPRYRPQRYYGAWCSYKIVVPIVDALDELGMLTQTESQRWYQFERRFKVWKGLSTVMAPTEQFVEFADRYGLWIGVLERAPLLECVVLRDENKVEIDYEDTNFTCATRLVIQDYNELMGSQVVSLAVPPGEQLDNTSLKVFETMFCRNGGRERRAIKNGTILGERTLQGIHSLDSLSLNHPQSLFFQSPSEIEPGGPPNPTPGSIEKSRPFFDIRPPLLTNLGVRRIFNETFDHGGRFFVGGDQNYQQLTKDLRKHIRINGEATAEPDFKCHHIRILYHLLEVDFRGDAYFFCDGDELFRDVMKDATLRIINTRSQGGASNSVNKLLKELRDKPEVGAQLPEEWTGPYLVRLFMRNHPRLVDVLWKGGRVVGSMLQNKDSQIMERIIARHVGEDIPLLCLHDSVRVPKSKQDLAVEIMADEYRKVMGFEPLVDRG